MSSKVVLYVVAILVVAFLVGYVWLLPKAPHMTPVTSREEPSVLVDQDDPRPRARSPIVLKRVTPSKVD